jgi:hypothetical protein
MKTRSCLLAAAGLCLMASTASAQIIMTSIPRLSATAQTTGGGRDGGEKKFAVHVMGSPMSLWKYNELAGGPVRNSSLFDVALFKGTPSSDFLLAGETVFKVGRDFSIGVGGWHNKVGKVTYGFGVATFDEYFDLVDIASGTLDGDLTLSEGHVSFFYKSVGVQAGVVHTNSKLTSSTILSSEAFPWAEGTALQSIEENNSVNDWDLYGVYKYSGDTKRPFGVSVGAGLYGKQGNTKSAQRAAEDQVVFSSFVTGTIDIYKGFGVDASYWYIAKTKADLLGLTVPLVADPASRFTFGVSYSFSR